MLATYHFKPFGKVISNGRGPELVPDLKEGPGLDVREIQVGENRG